MSMHGTRRRQRAAGDGGVLGRLPMACPVCSCERVDPTSSMGTECVCTNCGTISPILRARRAWAELVAPLTGTPDLEPGDVLAWREDPDVRPYIWEL